MRCRSLDFQRRATFDALENKRAGETKFSRLAKLLAALGLEFAALSRNAGVMAGFERFAALGDLAAREIRSSRMPIILGNT